MVVAYDPHHTVLLPLLGNQKIELFFCPTHSGGFQTSFYGGPRRTFWKQCCKIVDFQYVHMLLKREGDIQSYPPVVTHMV